jgi:hypothetical protein
VSSLPNDHDPSIPTVATTTPLRVVGVREGFDLAAFVAASCERHGVPLKVTDAAVRSKVTVLLTGRPVR